MTKTELENAERLEQIYSPETIRVSNSLLLAQNRLRQIENWRQERLRELEAQVASQEATKLASVRP